MTPTTIHQAVVRSYDFHKTLYGRHSNRGRRLVAMRRAVRETTPHAERRFAEHLRRDFRGWNRDGTRTGPGSGRQSDWLDVGFVRLARIARVIHEETGLRDGVCRKIAHLIHWNQTYASGPRDVWIDIASIAHLPPSVPWERSFLAVYSRSDSVRAALMPRHAGRWYSFARSILLRRVSEMEAADILSKDSEISGYLAASILKWQDGEGGYEGCSGTAYFEALRRHPETWDALLARAPTGRSGPGWEQCFPHEREKIERLRAAGWFETLRLSDSIFNDPAVEPTDPVLRTIMQARA